MTTSKKSRLSDSTTDSSLFSDTWRIGDILKAVRLSRQLSQAELAGKLGLRQRQVSDLERATVDPRLSTIQNVARALDLELMLIPRHLISAVNALQRSGSDAGRRPLYALSDEDTPEETDEPQRSEVGGDGQSDGQPARHSRTRSRP